MHACSQKSGRARCSGDRSRTRYRGTCDTCSQEGHPAAGAQAAHDSPVTNRIASPLREQMPACSSTPMLNAAALRTLFVPLAHGPLRLPKRDAGAP